MVELDPSRMPRHVAVIMDGNGRWAQQRGLSRLHGHRVGKDSVRAVVETARRLGIPYLSLYAFSSENWGRPPREVDGLMSLLHRYLETELGKMMRHQIRLLAVGSLRRLPPAVRDALRSTIEATRNNTGMTVIPSRIEVEARPVRTWDSSRRSAASVFSMSCLALVRTSSVMPAARARGCRCARPSPPS